MASGSTLSNGSSDLKICNDNPVGSNSPLTIANINCNPLGASGITTNSTFMTRLYAYLRDVENNPNINKISDVSALYSGVNGNTVLTVNGDLNITQDIKINDTISYTTHNVPQAIIFVNNGNVNISGGVTRIDAWLIVTSTDSTKGTINTCSEYTAGSDTNQGTSSDGAGFSGNQCTQQLAFNGPVIARNLNLRRSYGSDPLIPTTIRTGTFGTSSSKQAPAEIFNLRADSYLWAYAQASRYGSSYNEAYSRELAPRY